MKKQIPPLSELSELLLTPPLVSFNLPSKECPPKGEGEGKAAIPQCNPVEMILPGTSSPAILVYETAFDMLPDIVRAVESRSIAAVTLRRNGHTLHLNLIELSAQDLAQRSKLAVWAHRSSVQKR